MTFFRGFKHNFACGLHPDHFLPVLSHGFAAVRRARGARA
jgi:hypothetical protein